MKKLIINHSKNKIEIKNWKAFELKEMVECAEAILNFVSKRV